jgi:isoquinoline 1-oxidoreductase beta subunit
MPSIEIPAPMGRASHAAITFKDGKVQQGNFDDFPVIRIDESAVTNV